MNVESTFGPPGPLTDKQIQRLGALQEAFLVVARAIVANTSRGPERDASLEALRQSSVNAQIAASVSGRVTPEVVADWFAEVEARDSRVVRLWMNAVDYASVRKFGRDVLDIESQASRIHQGIMGTIWNAEIRVSRSVPQGKYAVIGEDQGEADLAVGWTPGPADLREV